MKQKRKLHYISIEEQLTWYGFGLKLTRSACIQFFQNGKNICRLYKNVSEASILRLAKIQEKLAQ